MTSAAPRARARSSLASLPGRGEDSRALQARDLDGRLADAAAGGQHEDVLAALQPRAGDQHVPGGDERQRKRRRVDERHRIGQRHQVLERHLDQLGVAPGMIAISKHLVVRALIVRA